MSNKRNKNRKRRRTEPEFDTPEPWQRIDFDEESRQELQALLTQPPWHVHKFFGDDVYGKCEKILYKNEQIFNKKTNIPTNIHPHQIKFLCKYHYLPADYNLLFANQRKKRKLNNNKNNVNIEKNTNIRNNNKKTKINTNINTTARNNRLIKRQNTKQRNIDIWKENKQIKYENRNKNKKKYEKKYNVDKLEISHNCGYESCITINHLDLVTHSENISRKKCHKEIDKKVRKRRARESSKKYVEQYGPYQKIKSMQLDEDDEIQCEHSPTCFRNYCQS